MSNIMQILKIHTVFHVRNQYRKNREFTLWNKGEGNHLPNSGVPGTSYSIYHQTYNNHLQVIDYL